jgi:hypothetical protein
VRAAAIGAALALVLTGCATVPREEIVYQTVHAIDTAQTLEIARHPDKFRETNLTMGEHPTTARVLGWSVTLGAAHYLVSDFLLAHDMPKTYAAWQFVTIGVTAKDVHDNYRIGLRLGF